MIVLKYKMLRNAENCRDILRNAEKSREMQRNSEKCREMQVVHCR